MDQFEESAVSNDIHMKAVAMEISHWGLGADYPIPPFICIQGSKRLL